MASYNNYVHLVISITTFVHAHISVAYLHEADQDNHSCSRESEGKYIQCHILDARANL